jgi:hypothetical protein
MRSLFIAAFLLAVTALAQDRTQAVPEAGAVWLKTEITPNPADGGCFLLAYGANDAGISVTPSPYDFGGARCVTVGTASLKAVKKDLRVGDGSNP